MALITSYRQKPICVPCQMRVINKPIEDKEFKALFDIKPELYERSSFLRNIKEAYLQYGSLSDKQKEVFVKVVGDLTAGREFKPKKISESKDDKPKEKADKSKKVKKPKKKVLSI